MPVSQQRFKRILNEIPQAVDDSLMGLVMCNPGLVLLEGERVIMRRDHLSLQGKVKLISGIGGGHEPGPTGFVGPGGLTAAIVGDIFRCPPANVILKTIREMGVNHPEGVLIIILNYVDHRLNFGLALERACVENINVRLLIVGDDCSILRPAAQLGRRGLAGITFAYKIAGAMAEEGHNIDDIYAACSDACETNISTISIGMQLPNIPGSLSFPKIADDEIDLGTGIGLETGIQLIPVAKSSAIAYQVLELLFANSPLLEANSEVAVMINNYGGSSKLEEAIFTKEVLQQLFTWKLVIRRVYSGSFITSLDMSGLSVSIWKLQQPELILKYLDAHTSVPGWARSLTWDPASRPTASQIDVSIAEPGRRPTTTAGGRGPDELGPRLSLRNADNLWRIVRFAAEAVHSVSMTLNTQDAESGDGDCGSNIGRGVKGIIRALDDREIDTCYPYAMLEQLCSVTELRMSGTSGALYSIFFAAAAEPFGRMPADAKVDSLAWLDGLLEGIEAIKRYGMAKQGDRTMLEPLIAAETAGREELSRGATSYKYLGEVMSQAAERASGETVVMNANCGRACYAIKGPLKMPDAGAYCVAVWMRAVSEGTKLLMPIS